MLSYGVNPGSPGLESVPGRLVTDRQTDRRTDGRTDRITIASTGGRGRRVTSWSLELRIPPLELSFVSQGGTVKIPLTGTGTARFSGSLVHKRL